MDQDRPIDDTTFVVVDVETTGMSPISDRITEIAMMKVRNGAIVDEFSTLVNPLTTIPAFITDITGIDNVMVYNAPTAREVVPYVQEFLHDAVFTAHNAAFDWAFVTHTARRERELQLVNNTLCTVKLSHRILPYLASKSLAPVARHLDVEIPQRHRASGDAFATARILIKFLDYLKQRYALRTVGEILTFQNLTTIPVN